MDEIDQAGAQQQVGTESRNPCLGGDLGAMPPSWVTPDALIGDLEGTALVLIAVKSPDFQSSTRIIAKRTNAAREVCCAIFPPHCTLQTASRAQPTARPPTQDECGAAVWRCVLSAKRSEPTNQERKYGAP